MQPSRRSRAAIYVRISKDKSGAGLGVERQERECRELAERLELEVVKVLVDNDLSAYSGKPRPAYQDLLTGIEAGHIESIVCWHTDRLHRTTRELEHFIEVARAIPTHSVQAGRLDLSTPDGRALAKTLGAWAQHEVELKSERQKAKNRQVAQQGFMPPGGPVPIGYNRDRLTLHAIAAPLLQEAHKRILRGESIGSVIRRFNDQGFPTPRWRGVPFPVKPWTYSTLTSVMRRPLNAGLMLLDGAILTGVETKWEPLVSLEDHYAMTALLADPTRRTTTGNKRKHLLSGIACCANCRRPLRAGAVGSRSGKTANLYRCANRDCSARVNVNRERLDEYVAGRLLAERGEAITVKPKPAEAVGVALAQVENQIGSVLARMALDDSDDEALSMRLKELKAERAALSEPQRVGFLLANLVHEWQQGENDVNTRRELLLGHLDGLYIASRGKVSHRFDSTRVALTWRPDPYDPSEDTPES